MKIENKKQNILSSKKQNFSVDFYRKEHKFLICEFSKKELIEKYKAGGDLLIEGRISAEKICEKNADTNADRICFIGIFPSKKMAMEAIARFQK